MVVWGVVVMGAFLAGREVVQVLAGKEVVQML